MATNHQPTTTQPLHQASTLSDGNTFHSPSVPDCRLVGSIDRPEGRVSTRSYPQRSQTVPPIRLQGDSLPVPLSTIRPFHSPPSLHQNYQGDSGFPTPETGTPLHVPRRLAHRGPHTTGHYPGPPSDGPADTRAGLHHQRREIFANAFPAANLPGSRNQPGCRPSHPNSGQIPSSTGLHSSLHDQPLSSSQNMAATARHDGKLDRFGPLVQNAHASTSAAPSLSLSPAKGPDFQGHPGHTTDPRSASVVVNSGQPDERHHIPPSLSIHICHYGCLEDGMGSSPRGPVHRRLLVHTTESITHQPLRATGGSTSTEVLPVQSPKPTRPGTDRQLHGSFLHQPSRRNSLSVPLPGNLGAASVVHSSGDLPRSHPLGREEEFVG